MTMLNSKCNYAYAKHRNRVANAKPIIDYKSPWIHTGNFARFSNLKQDMHTYVRHYRDNVRLLVSLNGTLRTRGVLNTFRTNNADAQSNIKHMTRRLIALDKVNFEFGRRLLCINSNTFTHHSDHVKFHENRSKSVFVAPRDVLAKYNNLTLPREGRLQRKLFRPTIWLNLEVKGLRPLGPIFIQFYTEAAPQIVLEFIRMASKEKNRIHFWRLFSGLWAVAQLFPSQNEVIITKDTDYDYRVLDHGQYSGILSFSLEHLDVCTRPCFEFVISFKKLRVLNDQRVGFGRILRGHKILQCLEDYATKNGKPIKEIIVKSCGLL